ncbi:MAG: TRZ/ATZ family hydrolase [Gammaproteobacteria bacterium]
MPASSRKPVDLVIASPWIVPVVPRDSLLTDHAIAISEQRIVDIAPAADIAEKYQPKESVQLDNHVLMPGMVNAHGHSPMALFRGIADDIPLMQWLEERIWPLEGQHVSTEFVRDGTLLAMAEMIRGGTTCFADMYFFPDEVAKAATETHIRVQLASPVLDFPTVWAQDAGEYISKATQLHDDYRSSELVYTAFGPHAPYTVSDEPLRKIAVLADELDVPIHIHMHEAAQEIEDALAKDGRRPLQRMQQLGIVSPRLLCVHATQLNHKEMQLLAETGASVIHCPSSNLKLASGFCEVEKLRKQGVNVALGTDGAASNNDLDMFGEMQLAALVAKAVAQDASALPAAAALETATINGAKAMGLDNDLGSLEPGKYADIAAVSMEALSSLPVNNPLSHLVYASGATDVTDVWCGGKNLLRNRELQTLDLAYIRQRSQHWQQMFSH